MVKWRYETLIEEMTAKARRILKIQSPAGVARVRGAGPGSGSPLIITPKRRLISMGLSSLMNLSRFSTAKSGGHQSRRSEDALASVDFGRRTLLFL